METPVRWNITVSKDLDLDLDLALRSFLGSQGMKKGDLSKFIEEAVRDEVFRRTIQSIKASNADTDPEDLQALIDDAVKDVRKASFAKKAR